MLKNIIAASMKNRFLIFFGATVILIWGMYSLSHTPIDAIPDLSDVQVIVVTNFPGQAPQIIEDQITYPLSTAMRTVPYAKTVRGYSFFGTSFIYVIFEDGTDLYWARSRVLEQLNFVSGRLPDGITPYLGPPATGVGWVYEYALVDMTGKNDLAKLRSIQDWYLRYELQAVPGVAEVASIGGFVKQYQVEIDPNKLVAYNIRLGSIAEAIRRSNNDVGGRVLEMAESEFIVRGLGYVKNVGDIEKVSVGVDDKGTPILIRDVATVHLGPEMRRGLAELNGEGETVGGIVIQRQGANAQEVIRNVKAKLASLKSSLPEGVEIQAVYDRSSLIQRAVNNLKEKLVEESIGVTLVCIGFLLHLRSALVAIISIPMGILMAFIIMNQQGLSANIMSLGGIAIAIGAMIDGSIVMIENAHKHLERDPGNKSHWQIIYEAAAEVGPALFISLLIITISFLPVFTLQAQEGRLFSPLAYTKTYAMAAAAFLAITLVPVLMGFFVRGKILPERKNPINRLLIGLYHPIIHLVLRAKTFTIVLAFFVALATLIPLKRMGTEFMPPLDEGDILYMPSALPGISITKARELLQQMDKIVKSFPEVQSVFGKIGRAETATDPAPLSMIESVIMFKPQQEWRMGVTLKSLIAEMNTATSFPGIANVWTMPIKTRIDMLSTGIKTPLGIKIAGDDLSTLQELGRNIESLLRDLPATRSVYAERVRGANYFDFVIDREAAARYGLTVGDIQDVIQTAIGGMSISQTVEGLERYPINLRYNREFRDSLERLQRVLVSTNKNEHIPLAQVSRISLKKGPDEIKSENARLNAWVYIDPKDIDVGSYVDQAQRILSEQLELPPGYNITWSGQFEYMQRAKERLKIVVPFTLIIIFLLLYLNFRNFSESLIVMLSLPFALIGGIWYLYYLKFELSVAVAVGFIALAGVAAEVGVLVLVYIDHAVQKKIQNGGISSLQDLHNAVMEGTSERVRPKMMTVAAILGGLMPIMWGHGTGTDVMQRIAAPMVGGMFSSIILTLIVIPAVYTLLLEHRWKNNTLAR